MNITIKITSAEQCFACVRQLLYYYPSLTLNITSDETIPTPSGTPQTDSHYFDLAGISPHCPCSICGRARDEARARRLAADSNSKGTGSEASGSADAKAAGASGPASGCAAPADSAPAYAWNPGAHTESAADARIEADAAAAERAARIDAETPNRRDYQEDSSDGDDSAYQ